VNSQRSNFFPYVLAALVSIAILTFLPVLMYFALLFATNDVGGPLNLLLIPCANFVAASSFTLVLFLPLSKLLDKLFQEVNGSILFSGVVLCFILLLVVISFTYTAVHVLGQQVPGPAMEEVFRFLLLGGVPFLLGGATFWFLLQVSRKLLPNREKRRD
jgi:hypothetical protein